jgi:hypothetical protein
VATPVSSIQPNPLFRGAPDRRSWEQHHLIPRAVQQLPQLAQFLAETAHPAPSLIDHGSNRIWLPSDEVVAARAGLCLHRGPHPHYTAVVTARVERIRQTAESRVAAAQRLDRLQRLLSAMLSGQYGPVLLLNRNDPMRLFSDYGPLDDAITALFD